MRSPVNGLAATGMPGRGRGRKVGTMLAALATTAAVTVAGVPAAQPARATDVGDILGVASKVSSYAGYVQTLYGLYGKYVLGQPSELDQIAALIKQSQQEIENQIDAIDVAGVNSEVDTAIEQFENIDGMSPDTLAAFTASAVKAVTDAKDQAVALPAGPALDNLGFDLNIVSPIALAASTKAGQATDILTTDIVQADQTVIQKLTPRCGVFAVDLQDTGSVLSQGHCWSYNVTFPTNPLTSVPEFFHPLGIGSNSFTVHGDYNGFDYTAPPVNDFSQALAQSVEATSYPIAQAALVSLAFPWVSEPPISAQTETLGGRQTVFGVTGFGGLFQGALAPNPSAGPGRYGISWAPEFSGPPLLKSVTSAQNSDGRVEVFALDRMGRIWHMWQTRPGDDTSWSPWAGMDGTLISISVARNHNGTLQLFGTGTNGKTFTRNQILGGDYVDQQSPPRPAVDAWTAWKMMPDGITSQDVAITNLAGRIELFTIGTDNTIFHKEENLWDATDPTVAGNWNDWTRLPASPTDTREIAAGTNGKGQIILTAVGAGDRVTDVLKIDDRGRDSDYTSWGQLSGPMHHIAMAGVTQGTVQLVGLDTTGNVFTDSLDGVASGTPAVPDGDTGWTQVPGELAPFPS